MYICIGSGKRCLELDIFNSWRTVYARVPLIGELWLDGTRRLSQENAFHFQSWRQICRDASS